MIDLFYGSLFGFYALLYMYIGYLNGFFCKVFYDDDIKVHIVLVAEKSDHQSLFFSAHQPKGGRQNQKKVRRYGRDLKILKYSCL